MRFTSRLLANLARTPTNHLTPGAPTGLTGVFTHPYPRPALLYLYTATLHKLEKLPQNSVYRTSAEALTRQRLNIVASVEPAGFAEWQQKVQDEYVPLLEKEQGKLAGTPDMVKRLELKGKPYIYQARRTFFIDERDLEWDGEAGSEVERGEGVRTEELRESQLAQAQHEQARMNMKSGIHVENEPQLTADQVSELEQKIGAGLIEEVIEVARGELELVDKMIEYNVWEELEEKPAEGQWKYFERKAD